MTQITEGLHSYTPWSSYCYHGYDIKHEKSIQSSHFVFAHWKKTMKSDFLCIFKKTWNLISSVKGKWIFWLSQLKKWDVKPWYTCATLLMRIINRFIRIVKKSCCDQLMDQYLFLPPRDGRFVICLIFTPLFYYMQYLI